MKILVTSVQNLEGQEIEIPYILAIRFIFDDQPENWIDVNFSRKKDNNLTIRGSHAILLSPNAANSIDAALESR